MRQKLTYLFLTLLLIGGGGKIKAQITQDGDGYYKIYNASDLAAFRDLVNNSATSGSKAKLQNDIDLSSISNWTPMGTDVSRFWGEFDGQGYRILNLTISGSTKEQGLFGVVSSATIRNLILDSSCSINSGDCTAALIGCCNGSGTLTIENVGIECDVTGTNQNCAAFLGCNYGGSGITIHITNCYNTGNVTGGRESAIITGWFGGHSNIEVRGFYNIGSVVWGQDGSSSLWRNGNNNITIERIYHLYADQGATQITFDDVSSGKLAYMLNGNSDAGIWHQNLDSGSGIDNHPTFGDNYALVYAAGIRCDGVANFANEPGISGTADHQWQDGMCLVCHQFLSGFEPTQSGGYYEIYTGADLSKAASMSQSNPAIKVKLMNDIDMDGIYFDGFGSDADGKRFTGEIDGQGYIIKNLKMEAFRDAVGLVNAATNGATVKNLTIGKNCEFKGNSVVAAFIGAIRASGDVYIENCGNEAPVFARGVNAGGIVGCRYTGTPHLTNVYNIGVITGLRQSESGSISGWLSDGILTNCYSIVDYVTAADTHGFQEGKQFSRGENIQLTNCYDYGTGDWGENGGDWHGVFDINSNRKIKSLDDVLSGRLLEGTVITASSFANPVNDTDVPDPDVIRGEDGIYYLYSTAEHVYSSSDLIHWTYKGQTNFLNGNRGNIANDGEGGVYWAPCIAKIGNKYAIYYAVSKVGGTNDAYIGMGMGDSPTGPFDITGTEKIITKQNSGVTNCIDPNVFHNDQDGKNYLVWGSHNGIYAIELDANGKPISNINANKKTLATWTGGNAYEAAHIYKHGNYYYLFASIGNFGDGTYQTVVGRSSNPFSGYVNKKGQSMSNGNYTALTQSNTALNGFVGFGHHTSIFEDNNGDTWMIMHAYKKNGNTTDTSKRVGVLAKVTWENDWPTLVMPSTSGMTGPAVHQYGLADVSDGVWHQSLGSFRHPVLYNGTEFDENYEGGQTPEANESNAIARLYRGLVAGNWNTICVPFSMTRAQINEAFGDGTELATLKDAKGETLHFQKLAATDGITAGTPYLIYPGHATTAATDVSDALFIKGVGIVSGEPQQIEETSEHNYTFIGTYAKGTDPENDDLFVGSGNKLVRQNAHGQAGGKMKGFRAYLKKAEGATGAKFFTVDDEPTGIMLPEGKTTTIDKVYNLNGQRVNPKNLRRGIYIVNGKKVLVK